MYEETKDIFNRWAAYKDSRGKEWKRQDAADAIATMAETYGIEAVSKCVDTAINNKSLAICWYIMIPGGKG